MKKSELIFTALLLPMDFIMIISAAIIAYFIRFTGTIVELRPILFDLPFKKYFIIVLIIAPVFLIIFSWLGLYNIKNRRIIDDIYGSFVGVSTGFVGIAIYIFLKAENFSSRFIIIASWFIAIILVIVGRFLIRYIQRKLYKYGYGVHRVVLIGNTSAAKNIIYTYNQPRSGYKIVAKIEKINEETFLKLDEIGKKFGIDEIVQTDPSIPKEKILDLIDFADDRRIDIKYIPDLFGTQATNIDVRAVAGIPIVELKRTPLDGWGKIIKRTIDIIFSIIGIIFFCPLFIIVAIAIKINSRGPVFVKLTRVSREKKFNMFKFRSMVKDAHLMKKDLLKYSERKGPLFKMKNDPRITKIGKILRKTRIDELPQFFNVLLNDMSLVGPRPHEPEEVSQYTKNQRKVLAIKPGMSGMAQVSGASDLSFDEEVKLDTYYIENWSLKLDLQILFRTGRIVLSGAGAA